MLCTGKKSFLGLQYFFKNDRRRRRPIIWHETQNVFEEIDDLRVVMVSNDLDSGFLRPGVSLEIGPICKPVVRPRIDSRVRKCL